ncbi:MAG: exo-alpha-sialidase [Candidatus Omnitrophica bacterium]|nr:exo-alpha-sialidase [Candidatus Omnitrophota bacterium]
MAAKKQLTIGDGGNWHFINGEWKDGADGLLGVREKDIYKDGDGMQNMHWAFNRSLACRNCTVRFEVSLKGHSDTGIIFRARNESHFYLLHFPNCGQASRAQHFWAVLSVMDGSGWLRHLKMDMVRRVPSQLGIWLPVELNITENSFYAQIGDYGRFEAEDDTFPEAGYVGLFSLGASGIRRVAVDGDFVRTHDWGDDIRQPKNWFHPVPAAGKVWQQPGDLKLFPDGELILVTGSQTVNDAGENALSLQQITRSADGGRTWSVPEPLNLGGSGHAWSPARIHITPGGRLIAIIGGTDHKLLRESADRGRTWSEPVKINLHLGPPLDKPAQQFSPHGLLNLNDGGMLALMLKSYPLKDPSLNVWTWGSIHCQAFSSRSDDDGFTWSEPVNMDTPGFDGKGMKLEGNLDLTEASAVQLGSGRVMAFIRPVYSPWMWETWSDDGGRTWGPCVRGPFPGYAAPNMVRTASGAILIAHRMPALNVNCSMDDGKTWDQGVTIDSGNWAMGSMVEVEPNLVLYVYWDTNYSLMRAQYLRVTPDGLVPAK